MLKKLGLLFLLPLQSACALWSQTLIIEDIPHKPDWQSRASQWSVQEFFDHRMQNRVRKAPVGNWMLVHENDEIVFVAYPRFVGLLSEQREADQLFSVNKAQLDTQFPAWRSLDGEAMQSLLQAHFKPQIVTQWKAQLLEDGIQVQGLLQDQKTFELKLSLQGQPL